MQKLNDQCTRNIKKKKKKQEVQLYTYSISRIKNLRPATILVL